MPIYNAAEKIVKPRASKKEVIRNIIGDLLIKCQIPYVVTPYDQELHDLCCAVARERGYPMGTDRSVPSLLPFIQSGVIIASVAYGHLESEATRVFISLYTAFLVYVDDAYQRDVQRVSVFNERFVLREPQEDPVLDGLADWLHEIPKHYERVAANIILTATLNLINASLLEFQTKGMQASIYAKGYPGFTRAMSGASEAYALMIFPPTVPLQSYIQALPELVAYIGYGNDVLSFYKEELAGETVNYISVLARCHGLSKMEAFERLATDVVGAQTQISVILETDKEAFEAWQKFKAGYVGFHTSFDRYLLDDLMD
ncbi:isoprenoid synthase domain-containing protein [Flammula alnicola]|nr:isoprenoid synthase domain-containing protein [Flammula alnicola]